jgi:hypothetical protein
MHFNYVNASIRLDISEFITINLMALTKSHQLKSAIVEFDMLEDLDMI